MADSIIRRAEARDVKAILSLARLSAEAGDAFPWEASVPEEELAFYWLPNPELHHETFVAEAPNGHGIMGAFVLQPAAGSRGAHIANGAFAVAPAARGQGLGKRLCATMVEQARQRGYVGLRFNTVVVTNTAAIRACLSAGFRIMCTLPQVFNHPQRGLVDAHVMYCEVDGTEEAPVAVGAVATPAAGATRASLAAAAPASPAVLSDSASVPTLRYTQSGGLGDDLCFLPWLGSARLFSADAEFSVQPPLPEGFALDPYSGVISGAARTSSGIASSSRVVTVSFSTEFSLQTAGAASESMSRRLSSRISSGVCSQDAAVVVSEDFAEQLERVVDAAGMRAIVPEPFKAKEYGNWMVWMVHRAWINDESLSELDFTSMHMPTGHLEQRIAPKLMRAVAWNTHLEVLSLSNSNLERAEGLLLAESLKQNCTLLELNVENNWLDSSTVRELALAIEANPKCILEHFRVSHQKQMGQFFGRPTEKAMGEMMQANETIVKLGFECDDAHWRNLIDRALLRNSDHWRRRQQGASILEELPAAEEKTLGHLTLQVPPQQVSAEKLFPPTSMPHVTFREYVVQTRKFPTTNQLQNCAKNSGMPMAYAVAAPLIKECRSCLLEYALNTGVVVCDAFGIETRGSLMSWKEQNEQWSLEVLADEGKRYMFRSRKEPGFSLAEEWAGWLHGTSRISIAGA